MLEDPWDEEGTARRACSDQLQKSLLAVQEHERLLRDVEEATRPTPFETPELNYCPIRIGLEPTERVFPHDLIRTENQQLAKVLTVFVYLCDEINELKDMAESKLYGPLVSFGQQPCPVSVEQDGLEDGALPPGSRERMVGRILPTLQELSNFVDRCYFVAVNLVQQVSALLNPKDALYRSVFHSCQLKQAFLSLGELLAVLITLDSIVAENDVLRDSWAQYKVMMSYARADPASFGMDAEKVATFEKLLLSIDQSVMGGEIFKGCIEQDFQFMAGVNGMPDMELNVRKNSTFLEALLASLKRCLEGSMAAVGTNVEFFERVHICGCFALYALYRQLLPANIAPDLKLHKVFWTVQKTVPWIFLCNQKTVWFPGDFLLGYSAAFDVRKLDPPNPPVYRKTFLNQFDQSFSQRVASISAQSKAWFILADSYVTPSVRHESDVNQALEVRSGVLLKGLSVAVRVNYLLRSYLIVHEAMEEPVSKSALADVATLIEVLKGIEYTYTRKQTEIAQSYALCIRHYAEVLVKVLQPLQTKLDTSRKLDSTRHDVLGVISVLASVLKSSDSMHYTRLMVVMMTSDILSGVSGLGEKENEKMKLMVRRISCLSQLSKSIRNVCDTQFLYFHRPIFSYLVQDVYNQAIAPSRLHYLVGAFADGARTCMSILHAAPAADGNTGENAEFLSRYRSYVTSVVRSVVINPLCRELENDLRLHIHTKTLSHLQNVNPKTDNLRPLRPFLDMAPLKFLGTVVDIKATVSHYLDHVFYSLTTLALHDWRTYSDMKALAADKFGLALLDSFLPMGSLDQGLDVLQIMRNINVFVGRFTYNMNMQQFIEYRPDKASKHINTINIQSIAASIRQHGLGVLNTTVNYTYQFLSQKFHIFSQFLYDDYIRAHLSREYRWFKKHKHDPEVNNMYPYERGLKFMRDIRKLGVNEHGKSFLDQFRILVTEIGNALGYVRMVRSASMYYCSEAVKFLPELDEIAKFEHHAGTGVPLPTQPAEEGVEAPPGGFEPDTGAGFSAETVRSAKTLDDVIETLVKNFGEGSDYFKVLVNVFQSVLLTEEHEHLRTFFMIVPSMCLSWVDASLQAKDTMYKATRGNTVREMYFTDDGFAMGVAYCLAILKQTRKFESVYWFDSVRAKHKADFADLEKSQKARAAKEARKKEKSKGGVMSFFSGKKKEEVDVEEDHEDYEEIHTLQLTSKRLEAQRREVGQLSFSVSGATIFFKRTDMDT